MSPKIGVWKYSESKINKAIISLKTAPDILHTACCKSLPASGHPKAHYSAINVVKNIQTF
jgi:hypothetical protein